MAVPAAAVLTLTALPFRLVQAQFVELLIRLGNEAPEYGNLLSAVSAMMVVAYLFSIYGRAVYMQACRVTPGSWRELLRVDPVALISYAYVSLLLYLSLIVIGIAVLPIPLLILIAGVSAAVLTESSRPVGPFISLRELSPYFSAGGVLLALLLVFTVALVAVVINLTYLAQLVTWLWSWIPGADLTRWNAASGTSIRFDLIRLVAALSIVEPFWLAAMHLYVERVRARQTGDDLRRRFHAITGPRIAVAILAVWCAVAVEAEPITVEVYLQRLESVASALAAGHADEAAADVAALQSATVVRSGSTEFAPDDSLIDAAARVAADRAADPALLRRLKVTMAALRAVEGVRASRAPDPDLLHRIRERERAGELWRGGSVMALPEGNETAFTEFARMWRSLISWAAEKLERLFDFFTSLFRREAAAEERRFMGVSMVVWGVTLLVVAIVIFLGVYILRRSHRRPPPIRGAAASSSLRDEDPLSREANEWEIYARELTASARHREALRAWYHAVLMTLFRAGILHYGKGVTNWEYVARLGPELEWRTRFVALTHEFERGWYGHSDTTPEQLDTCATQAGAVLASVHGGGR